MTRAEVLAAYAVDAHGLITSPGKFEGLLLYVPALWDQCLNGFGLGMEGDEDEGYSERVLIGDDDLREFPELKDVHACVLWETDQGFVMCAEEPRDYPTD